jgi:hypothetical protein
MWFVDTASLVTMAVHSPLHTRVIRYLSGHKVVLLSTIETELVNLKRSAPVPTSTWAGMALTQLGWLGTTVVTPSAVVETALDVQDELMAEAGGGGNDEHWGESVIIAMGKRLANIDGMLLTEDYNARVAAKRHQMDAMSLTRLIHHMMHDGACSATQAAAYTAALVAAKRWTKHPPLSAEDFTNGRLGIHGRPIIQRPRT